jgi:hypothetical protein
MSISSGTFGGEAGTWSIGITIGVAGGALLVGIAVLIVFFIMKRQREREEAEDGPPEADMAPTAVVDPTTTPQSPNPLDHDGAAAVSVAATREEDGIEVDDMEEYEEEVEELVEVKEPGKDGDEDGLNCTTILIKKKVKKTRKKEKSKDHAKAEKERLRQAMTNMHAVNAISQEQKKRKPSSTGAHWRP